LTATSAPDVTASNSELRTFQDCQRRWYLGYHLGLAIKPEDDRPVGDAKLGTRVHLALELWYGHGLDPLAALRAQYDRARVGRTNDQDLTRLGAEQDLALAMVEGYQDWVAETGADDGLEVTAVEDELLVPSGVTGITFRAKLDQRLLRRHDGARLFLDHKTVGSFEHSTTLLHMDAQMRFYSMLDRLLAARDPAHPRVDGGLWNMLRRSKRTARATPPFYRRDEVRYNQQELRSTWRKAVLIARRIQAAKIELAAGVDHHDVVPPTPSRDCLWKCDFVRVCPLFDDGSDVGGAVLALYTQRDPYAYYQGDAELIRADLQAA
jgi:PD-(D/E)XK nuclease superfamily